MVLATKFENGIVFSALYGFLCTVVVGIAMAKGSSSNGPEPTFAEPIPNITVAAGRHVTLPCVVENLESYRVAWIHTDRHTLLSLHDRLITRNTRYGISHTSYRTWLLHINNVEERDSGEYMCQINTSPMKSQVGYLEVVVSPRIEEEFTSSDTDVREGRDISMRCIASGSPFPHIKWRREDDKEIVIGTKKLPTVHGEYLNITKTSRLHMGAYLCIASNGVPPSVSKRIMLRVNFAPMIWIPNQLVGAPLGTDVTLDCNLDSFPRSITYWKRDETVILSNNKYDSMVVNAGPYRFHLKLRIRNLHLEDLGSYECVAQNSLGETQGTIKLYEIPRPTSSTTTSRVLYSSGTQQTNSEKVLINTWQRSQSSDVVDAKKSDLPGEVMAVESNVGFVPSAAGQDVAEQDTGISGTRESRSDVPELLLSNLVLYLCAVLKIMI